MATRTAADPLALLAVEDPELLLDAVIVTDATGTITAVNRAFTRLHGYEPRDVVGHRPRVLSSGLQHAAVAAQLWRTIVAGDAWEGELIDRGIDGAIRTVRTRITPVRDPGGRISHYVGVQREVVPSDGGATGHLRVDVHGRCTYADDAAAALLRADRDPVALLGDGLLRTLAVEDAVALHEVAGHATTVARTAHVDLAGLDGYVRCRVSPDAGAKDLSAGAVVSISCRALPIEA